MELTIFSCRLTMTKKQLLLLAFVLLKFVAQYALIDDSYELHRDEFLHLDQGHHLAWGYLSVPPVTSWIAFLISLLGSSVFWVKFFPALFGALTIVVVFKTIDTLGGSLFALALGCLAVLFSAILRINTLFQPNSLDVLLWVSFYFILIKYLQSKKWSWLYIGAVVFAVGFLNKYNFVFLLLGLLPAVLLTEHRALFVRRSFYAALAVGLLLISPNLIWQYNNNFPVFYHLKELAATQLVHVQRINFLKEQVIFFMGALFIIISGLYALLFYAPFKKYILFLWSILFTLALFLALKAKGYYAIGIYPVYIAFGAVFLDNIFSTGYKKYLQPLVLAVPVLLFIPVYSIGFPNKKPDEIIANPKRYKDFGLLRWEDGKDHALPQDFADMIGWKALAEKVDSICATLPHPEETLLLCDNYGQAGAINYYSKNNSIPAMSFHADYINWFNLKQQITDVVLVKEMDDEDKGRREELPIFECVYLAGKRISKYAREPEISIYVLRGAKTDITRRLINEINQKKWGWR
jgi:Dolichyl-phosphate-mannose-protein mannosyltransferase